jgi:hypothetical protein
MSTTRLVTRVRDVTTSDGRVTTAKRVRRRLAAAALVAGTVGVGMGVVAPAGVAHAYNGHCAGEDGPHGLPAGIFDVREFSLQGGARGDLVTVEVYAAMPQSDAKLFIDRPGDEGIFRLWGDDPDSDDLLATFRPEHYWVTPEGLGMRGATLVSDSTMNEDAFPDPAAQTDEFYVGIRLTDIRNGSEHKVETCDLTLAF